MWTGPRRSAVGGTSVGAGLPRSSSAFSDCHPNFHEMATVRQGTTQPVCVNWGATWPGSKGFGFFRLPCELQRRPHCGTAESESSFGTSAVENILEEHVCSLMWSTICLKGQKNCENVRIAGILAWIWSGHLTNKSAWANSSRYSFVVQTLNI
jgi:hypothetical protein